jgi:hypothetical protein
MVDEVEIIRRAFGTAMLDPEARERARARLHEAMASEQPIASISSRERSILRPVRWLGIAAAVIIGVLVAQTILPPHQGGPTSATAELRQLASVALSSRPLTIPEGSYLYRSIELAGVTTLVSLGTDQENDVNLYEVSTVEEWVAADGSGRRVTTIHYVSFLTGTDHERWLASGSQPHPHAGTSTDILEPGEFPNYDLSQLPIDPHALGTLIRSGAVNGGGSTDRDVLSAVGSLLVSGTASPELRASLFQVAADLPSIESLGSVQDPSGRTGLGVQLVEGSNAYELIFDPTTSDLLARLTVSLAGETSSSEVFKSSGIVSSLKAKV